jgi:addiction module HigA family antidote
MIKSFGNKEAELLFNRVKIKNFPAGVQQRARRKLLLIHFAVDEKDLKIPPGNHFEKLKGKRKDQCSIRINDQWRVVLKEIAMKQEKLDLIYPGIFLYEEFMEPLKITAYKLAKDIKVQQTAISQIINGKRRISVDMALRLSRYFGNSAQFWLNMQDHYDLELEIERKGALLNEIVPYKKLQEVAAG